MVMTEKIASLKLDSASFKSAVEQQSTNPKCLPSFHVGSLPHNTKLQLERITSVEDFCNHSSELETAIAEFSCQSLADLYPNLLAIIFGYGGNPGWKLKYIDRKSLPHVYDRIYLFLHTNGKLFKLIERLLTESATKFHFPVECLPEKTRFDLANGIIAPFYQDKLPVALGGQPPPQLELNALEYYLFLFAYYIVRPSSKVDNTQWSRYCDNLYHAVFELYLNHFLPADGSEISFKAASTTRDGTKDSLCSRSETTNHDMQNAQIFITSLTGFRPRTNILVSNLSADSVRRRTWRSEAFVQIVCEFWLSYHSSGSPISLSGMNREYNLPSEDQVRTIRMLVKHTHAFVNSAKTPIPSINQITTELGSATDQFKHMIIPTYIQKRLYNFFKYTFAHWPLDPSFKMVLETWLSYIQPWRYISGSYCEHQDIQDGDLVSWKPFITENVLFYSAFLRLFIPRALRFDLKSTSDIHQLFRVLKVFSQANLFEILEEVDRNVSPDATTRLHSFGGPSPLSTSYLGLQRRPKHDDLEELRCGYKSLLDEQLVYQCKELACRLSDTVASLRREEMRKERQKQKQRNESLLHRIQAFFSGNQEFEEVNEEKLLEYLEKSYATLVTKFQLRLPHQIPVPHLRDLTEVDGVLPRPRLLSDVSDEGTNIPDCKMTENGLVLTPKGRLQVINGVKRFDVDYNGDLDLQPIRSYEVAYLIRTLFTLSCTMNERFRGELQNLYNRQDTLGNVLRFIAVKPARRYSPLQEKDYSSNVEARISLRFLASQYTLGYFLWLILLLKLLGMGIIGIFFASIILMLFALVKNVMLTEAKAKDE